MINAAKHQLARMHADCSARMADLTASLAPTALDLQRQRLLPDMSSQAMALLQAQQQLAQLAQMQPVDPMTPMMVPAPQVPPQAVFTVGLGESQAHEEEDVEESEPLKQARSARV